MSKFYLDAGTTWSKILEVKPNGERQYSVLPTMEMKTMHQDTKFERVCGHSGGQNAKTCINEVVALTHGAMEHLKPNNIVLDLGSRDIKRVNFKQGKFHDMDWNTSCASATGATVEMLLKFYNIDAGTLEFENEKYPITCAIFGLEKIMDEVSKGVQARVAISKFIHGLAFNAFNFCKNPESLFVSGGFCENKCFMESLNKYCKALPLGRFVLVDGLSKM